MYLHSSPTFLVDWCPNATTASRSLWDEKRKFDLLHNSMWYFVWYEVCTRCVVPSNKRMFVFVEKIVTTFQGAFYGPHLCSQFLLVPTSGSQKETKWRKYNTWRYSIGHTKQSGLLSFVFCQSVSPSQPKCKDSYNMHDTRAAKFHSFCCAIVYTSTRCEEIILHRGWWDHSFHCLGRYTAVPGTWFP